MKRVYLSLMSLLIVCTSFVGCGASDSDSKYSSDIDASESSTESIDVDFEETSKLLEENYTQDTTQQSGLEIEDKSDEKLTDLENPLGEKVINEIEFSDNLFSCISEIEKSDTYTIDASAYNLIYADSIKDISIKDIIETNSSYANTTIITTNGLYTYVNCKAFGDGISILVTDSSTYILDKHEKAYCEIPSTADIDTDLLDINENINHIDNVISEDIVPIRENAKSAYKVEINNEEFIRVESIIDNEDSLVYAKDGVIKYIVVQFEHGQSLIVFNEISTNSRDELLEIPDDYLEVDIEEYIDAQYGELILDSIESNKTTD